MGAGGGCWWWREADDGAMVVGEMMGGGGCGVLGVYGRRKMEMEGENGCTAG
jgi:hypothetical protein